MKKSGNKCARNIKNNLGILFLTILMSISGCHLTQNESGKTPIAKIYDSYLYLEDIPAKIYRGKSVDDSLSALHQYMEDWAYKTLILKQAERNVDTVKINHLTRQFKKDLLTETYKELLLQKFIDTIVPADTLQKYYQTYKQYFISTNNYVLPQFVVVTKRNAKVSKIRKWFFSGHAAYADSLVKNTPAFTHYNLEGNKWYKLTAFQKELPVLKKINEKYILKKRKKFVLTDSLSLYLVFIKNAVSKQEILPLELVQNDLKQLILSQRKKQALSQLKNHLKEEAISKKIFKIYKTKTVQ